jgi:predicted flap endonuclease-1-like 5' DNA nuclease
MKKSEMKQGPLFEMWLIGAAAGLVAAAVMMIVGDYGWMAAGFVGAVIAAIVAFVFGMPNAAPVELPVSGGVAAGTREAAVAKPEAAVVAAPAMAEAAPAVVKAAPAAAEVAPAAFVAQPVPATTAVPAAAAAAAKPAKPAAAKPAKPAAAKSAKPAAAKPVKAKVADGPERLSGPRKGKADDLKEIEGIGPAMEKLCNGMGFYHFDQIAGWSDADVAYVDANMKTFKGRIVRDKWVAQAKLIVSEGLEAFRIRAQTNNY